MALRPNESGYYVAIFTCWWLSILFDIIFALLANGWCAAFAVTFQKDALVFEPLWEFYSGKTKCMRQKNCLWQRIWWSKFRIKVIYFCKSHLPALLELGPTICTLDYGKRSSAFLQIDNISYFLFVGTNKKYLMKFFRFLSKYFLNKVLFSLLRLLIVRLYYRS